jgi:gamma-glutamyltranspeptidase
VEVWEHPPNGQGIVALIALGILEELEKSGMIPIFTEKDHNTATYLHAVIEALRIAFADGSWWVADSSNYFNSRINMTLTSRRRCGRTNKRPYLAAISCRTS